MRTIFSRILLSFILTILLTGLISALVLFSFSRRQDGMVHHGALHRTPVDFAAVVTLLGQGARSIQRSQGDEEFFNFIQKISNTLHIRLYLSTNGQVTPPPPASEQPIAQMVATAIQTGQPSLFENHDLVSTVQPLFATDGTAPMVVGLHTKGHPPTWGDGGPPPPPGHPHGLHPPPDHPGGLPPPPVRDAFFLFVFALVAGLTCYFLARSVSAPLNRLRAITQRITGGDLSARIGDSLGRPGKEINELALDFDHMADRVEGLIKTQQRLLHDISHELRSPLARLNLALELAKNRFQAEEDEHFARIAHESERLNTLIGQLLTLTRVEGLSQTQGMAAVHLADLVREIAEDVDFEIRLKGKKVQILPCAPLVVHGSRELLRQAIENIVRNGARYTRTLVEISLSAQTAQLPGPRLAVIRIRDYGPGVPEEHLPHLTEPFYRVAEARDRNSGGTGLGLAIALKVARQHGGSLTLANAPEGGGLIVEILLPAQDSPE